MNCAYSVGLAIEIRPTFLRSRIDVIRRSIGRVGSRAISQCAARYTQDTTRAAGMDTILPYTIRGSITPPESRFPARLTVSSPRSAQNKNKSKNKKNFMTPESDIVKGYNEAANDLATALTELRNHSECIDIKDLVTRFNHLRMIRFERQISPDDLRRFLNEDE